MVATATWTEKMIGMDIVCIKISDRMILKENF